MAQPKKVLIVCYYWPPAGGPGVQRWLKFVKYLPDFGIEPIVYIPKNPSYPIIDTHLIKEVPEGITILKQAIREPYGIASLLSRKQTKSISSGLVPAQKKQSLLQKLMLYIRGNCFVPDARVGWVKPSISFLEGYLIKENIQTLITTGPPHSMHLIGLGLKTKLPTLTWMADFRDPWTTIGYHDKLKMTSKTKERHKKLEKTVLDNASSIIVTSPTTKKEFSLITNTPISVITNGYDVLENEAIVLNNTFTIAHIGSLLSDRNPNIFWKILADLIESNKAFKEVFKLKLAGRVSEAVLESIKDFGLESYVQLEGYIPHTEAIAMQRTANVLLLLEIDSPATRSIIPGKLFEYLAARRPILAIGPAGSDIEEIITSTASGGFYTYTQEARIKMEILSHFKKFVAREDRLQKGAIAKYHRKNLTKALSNSILQ